MWNPWAHHVMTGRKPWETRTHERFKSLVGKWVCIHASDHLDKSNEAFLSEWTKGLMTYKEMESLPHGCVLGAVFFDEFSKLDESHSALALIDCKNVGRFGLHVAAIKQFETPIPCKGGQGIFYFDLSTGQKIKKPKLQPELF